LHKADDTMLVVEVLRLASVWQAMQLALCVMLVPSKAC
jgi:hypothetical protein